MGKGEYPATSTSTSGAKEFVTCHCHQTELLPNVVLLYLPTKIPISACAPKALYLDVYPYPGTGTR
eukprot:245212-Rhodomonas_salina.1